MAPKKIITIIFTALCTLTILYLLSCNKEELPDLMGHTNKISFENMVVSDIGYYQITVSNSITQNGNKNITEHGFCWDTIIDPDLSDNKSSLGALNTGAGFSSTLTGLQPNTTYYIKTYVTFSEATVYSAQQSFTTNALGIPTLTTKEITEITTVSASSGGEITDGGGIITSRGVCWDTTGNPTITDNKTVDGMGTGIFSSEITGLNPGTTYYVRAYATNEAATAYGNEVSFTTDDGLPTISTTEITNIFAASAESGGNITDDGGFPIIARGVCWNTSQNPTITNDTTIDGNGNGSFTSQLTNLDVNTTYYVRAYATNNIGTSYGNEVSFTTDDGIPTISTTEITNIFAASAESGGNITDDGGFPITARGVCWNTSQNPTITNDTTIDGNGVGSFTSQLTNLDTNTTYYVRAYATNNIGTYYGNELDFITNDDEPITELIKNGNFTYGLNYWDTYFMEGANATITVESGSLHVNIISIGIYVYDLQVSQTTPGFILTQGKEYKLSFDSWADADRGLNVSVWENGHDLNDDGFPHSPHSYSTYDITTTRETYSVTFIMNVTNIDAGLAFFCGESTIDIYFDNVSLKEVK